MGVGEGGMKNTEYSTQECHKIPEGYPFQCDLRISEVRQSNQQPNKGSLLHVNVSAVIIDPNRNFR